MIAAMISEMNGLKRDYCLLWSVCAYFSDVLVACFPFYLQRNMNMTKYNILKGDY